MNANINYKFYFINISTNALNKIEERCFTNKNVINSNINKILYVINEVLNQREESFFFEGKREESCFTNKNVINPNSLKKKCYKS